jgi:tetratricopeptide (TPR) repeat protein
MHKLIKELRRREVFRTAGLYVGIAWIVVEASSVLFDAFEAPDWALQAVIIIAIIGLPVTIVLAWIFDITDHGIEVQADATDTQVIPFGGRRTDFAVIGVLSVALIFSVYLNIAGKVDTADAPLEPLSILIADFDNRTGNPIFDGALEQALNIGIESAPFVTSYSRSSVLAEAVRLGLGDKLDSDLSRLMSVREGIDLVLLGGVAPDGSGFEISVVAVDPAADETIASESVSADSTADVLMAVGKLSEDLRKALGDDTIGRKEAGAVETFTAASLEAAKAYSQAQELALAGNHEEALAFYASAVEQDPNFGRALSGWALSLFNLGRTAEATELWEQALSKMDTMTERERLRTLGLYYMVVSGNYEKAKESYQSLVDKFPADGPGHNNLAIAHFATLDFAAALEEGQRVLEIYPNRALFRSNFALYAMYAGDFDTAEVEAQKTLEQDSERYVAWLPVAMAALSRGEHEAAREAYTMMAEVGQRGRSVASLGVADIEMYLGNFEAAIDILNEGIDYDEEVGNQRSQATKLVALAEAHASEGNAAEARIALEQALAVSAGLARRVPAALTYLELGDTSEVGALADLMGEALQSQSRAYSLLIEAKLLLATETSIDALDKIRDSLALADLWLIRFHLGQAYLRAGYSAEALDEFTNCENRRGEATALFLDDLPTWRYTAPLPYWKGRAQEDLGMTAAAQESYGAFLAIRPEGDPLADDARGRVQ